MKILIADDHAVLRKGLIRILADEFPAAEFGEAGSTAETLDLLDEDSWDLLLLDIFMPGRGGLDVLRDTRRLHPTLPVLVLSSAPEEQMGVRVLKAGASGYLNKQAAPDDMFDAIRKLLAGRRYISGAMAEQLATEMTRSEKPPHETLSNREFDVLQRLVAGKSIKETAALLSLSAKTISTFHTRIWLKLGVQNDVEMMRYALDHGLIPPK